MKYYESISLGTKYNFKRTDIICREATKVKEDKICDAGKKELMNKFAGKDGSRRMVPFFIL